jgi:hypothetical protein
MKRLLVLVVVLWAPAGLAQNFAPNPSTPCVIAVNSGFNFPIVAVIQQVWLNMDQIGQSLNSQDEQTGIKDPAVPGQVFPEFPVLDTPTYINKTIGLCFRSILNRTGLNIGEAAEMVYTELPGSPVAGIFGKAP